MKYILLLSCYCFFIAGSLCQRTYSLSECLAFGMENAQNRISQESMVQQAVITARYGKWSFLPSLSASPNYNISYGRKLDPFTNTFGVNSVYSNTYGLGAQMTLFQSFYYFKQNKYFRQSIHNAELDLARKQEVNKIQIFEKCIAIWKVQQKIQQQETIIQNLARFKERQHELVKEGRLSALDTLLTASDIKVQQITLKGYLNNLAYETINLNFLMGLPLTNPTLLQAYTSQSEIVQLSLDEYYQVEDLKGKLALSELQQKLDRTRLLPSLILNGSAGTGYSTNNVDYNLSTLPVISFRDQFNQNAYQGIGFYLNVPLFNKGEWHKSQKLYAIRKEEQLQLITWKELELEKRKLEIHAEQTNLEETLLLQKEILTDKETIFKMTQEIYLEGRIRLSEVEKIEAEYYSYLATVQELEIELLKLNCIVFK